MKHLVDVGEVLRAVRRWGVPIECEDAIRALVPFTFTDEDVCRAANRYAELRHASIGSCDDHARAILAAGWQRCGMTKGGLRILERLIPCSHGVNQVGTCECPPECSCRIQWCPPAERTLPPRARHGGRDAFIAALNDYGDVEYHRALGKNTLATMVEVKAAVIAAFDARPAADAHAGEVVVRRVK